MNKLSPIILFVYNRPEHTRKTIKALKYNKHARKSKLFIFSDGPKDKAAIDKVNEVKKYIKSIEGFKKVEIIERDKNLGLANSVITGVTEVINRYGKVIVLEDDIVTSPAFLVYMNKLLSKYKDEEKIYSITGYNFPPRLMSISENYPYDVYFSPRAASWSWGTWKDRWKKADWEIKDYNKFINDKKEQKDFNKGGNDMTRMLKQQMDSRIDSWAIRWCYTLFKNDGLCVYPVESYVDNIGHDGSGIHCGRFSINKYKNYSLNKTSKIILPNKITLDSQIIKSFKNVFETNSIANIIRKFVQNKL